MGFREGLEAFLVIAIMLRYIVKIGEIPLKKYIWIGTGIGIVASLGFGGILAVIGNAIGNTGQVAKLWESGASLLALVLITTFIIWMIKNGSNMVTTIESNVNKNISKIGIVLVASTMVAREGAEIAIFTFTGKYGLSSITLGILISLVLAILIYFSLVNHI
jgi:high-affinity iron transporter